MSESLERTLGGKGAKLARLASADCVVPPWFGIDASTFSVVRDDPGVQQALADARALVDADDMEAAGDLVRGAILEVALPDELHASIVERWKTLASPIVAVRSSAIGEDAGDASFAGQFDSVLGVRSEAQLIQAVKTCWASAYTGRAIAYRARHGMQALEATMGVVVQHQIDSDVAGVMFTADPITGDPYTIVISSTWGLGEALVSGIANADTFRYERRGGAIDADIADKDVQIVLSPGGLTEETSVPDHRRNEPSLSSEQVADLARIGLALEKSEGGAQDIEWAIEDGELFILQTRPITSALRPRGLHRVWDNSNIVESYSGVVAPLTFSFAREAYGAVYLQVMRLLRAPKDEMQRAEVIVRQMLGYLDGRVYYNLASWYYLLSVLPNYEKNQAAMEQMMGVRQALDQKVVPPASKAKKLAVMVNLMYRMATIKRAIKAFRANVFGTLDRYDLDFDSLDADELVDAYEQLKHNLLNNWQTPIVNDTRVMITFARLKSNIEAAGIDSTGTLQNDLLCGQGDVESAEPTYLLMRVAERIRADRQMTALVLDTPDEQLRAAITACDNDLSRHIDEQLAIYMRRFGDRCANELKLETPTLAENPAFLFSVLRNFVSQHDLTESRLKQQELAIRHKAEAQVLASIGARRFGSIRVRIFNWWLNQARNAVADREALRFDRTRVFGLARRILSALGKRIAEGGLLDDWRDVFFLEVDEVIGTVQGTCTTTDLRGLVAIRKAQHERWLTNELPDRIETIGVTNANPFEDAYAAVDVSGDSLSGIGCCPGVVRRAARVVHSPDAGVRLDGDIMVCTRTDPGWVPLFPSCGGLLVERGSLLSHSAIVAREFGIPAIVGIPGLMAWARDGEELQMDGTTGIVSRPETDTPADTADDTGAVTDSEVPV